MKFILGKKLENSQLFFEDGRVVPATSIQAGPCWVAKIKTKETDGYSAVQIGFSLKKRLNKALAGHLNGLPNLRFLKEFKLDENQSVARGQQIGVNSFAEGERIKLTGTSKGKGFQGVVRRHGFSGQPATHGHKDQERASGSIGSTGPQRVLPGTKMAGRMGNDTVTLNDVEIVKIDEEKNLLFVKGPVPGARNGLVMISGAGELKPFKEAKHEVSEVKQEAEVLPTGSQAGSQEPTVEEIKETPESTEQPKQE